MRNKTWKAARAAAMVALVGVGAPAAEAAGQGEAATRITMKVYTETLYPMDRTRVEWEAWGKHAVDAEQARIRARDGAAEAQIAWGEVTKGDEGLETVKGSRRSIEGAPEKLGNQIHGERGVMVRWREKVLYEGLVTAEHVKQWHQSLPEGTNASILRLTYEAGPAKWPREDYERQAKRTLREAASRAAVLLEAVGGGEGRKAHIVKTDTGHPQRGWEPVVMDREAWIEEREETWVTMEVSRTAQDREGKGNTAATVLRSEHTWVENNLSTMNVRLTVSHEAGAKGRVWEIVEKRGARIERILEDGGWAVARQGASGGTRLVWVKRRTEPNHWQVREVVERQWVATKRRDGSGESDWAESRLQELRAEADTFENIALDIHAGEKVGKVKFHQHTLEVTAAVEARARAEKSLLARGCTKQEVREARVRSIGTDEEREQQVIRQYGGTRMEASMAKSASPEPATGRGRTRIEAWSRVTLEADCAKRTANPLA